MEEDKQWKGYLSPQPPDPKRVYGTARARVTMHPRAYDGGANGAESSLLGDDYTDSMIKGNP